MYYVGRCQDFEGVFNKKPLGAKIIYTYIRYFEELAKCVGGYTKVEEAAFDLTWLYRQVQQKGPDVTLASMKGLLMKKQWPCTGVRSANGTRPFAGVVMFVLGVSLPQVSLLPGTYLSFASTQCKVCSLGRPGSSMYLQHFLLISFSQPSSDPSIRRLYPLSQGTAPRHTSPLFQRH